MNEKHLGKKWNSLYDLCRYLESNEIEVIKEFTGDRLVTDKRTYGLFDGNLSFKENEDVA